MNDDNTFGWDIEIEYETDHHESGIYRVFSYDDIRPEHKEVVAVLLAASGEADFGSITHSSNIDGIGYYRNFRTLGPYFYIQRGEHEKEG